MKFVAYLSFDGCCREAFEFYAKVLGGKIAAMLSHGETPAGEHVSSDWQDKIINAHLIAGDQELMGADSPPEMGGGAKEGFSISIQIDEEKDAERIFNAFADGGTVTMPFEPTFWAKKFGMVTDKYGTPWMINCGVAG
ncbi:VOC family protein [Shinella sp. CPCC 101442]|uniref:VOC family protein n=1 Tax=Shinella sp. CPCC 101442 TaxID=2932265 RepID=UPI00215239C2|nr:VOC family protein [Shinella sp. CPCC 101442]MCR6498872.1 VOC family protein [Shinella sp. CPCC 101442]